MEYKLPLGTLLVYDIILKATGSLTWPWVWALWPLWVFAILWLLVLIFISALGK